MSGKPLMVLIHDDLADSRMYLRKDNGPLLKCLLHPSTGKIGREKTRTLKYTNPIYFIRHSL